MKISTILVIIILISIFTTGFISFYGALISSGEISGRFDRVNDTSQTLISVENMYNIVEESQNSSAVEGFTITSGPENLIIGAFNAGMQTLNLPIFFMGLLTDLANAANLPIWFTSGVIGIIFILLIVGLIKFTTGRDF